jgi:hypothetical protein
MIAITTSNSMSVKAHRCDKFTTAPGRSAFAHIEFKNRFMVQSFVQGA